MNLRRFLIEPCRETGTISRPRSKTYGGAAQNFVYADVKGNIGWYAAGRYRSAGPATALFPYDGSTNDGDWTGSIPFEELPNLYNPPTGLIVTANQRTVGTRTNTRNSP